MISLTTLPALPYPAIDPVLLQIGPVAIRWYGLSYVVGLGLGVVIFCPALRICRRAGLRWPLALVVFVPLVGPLILLALLGKGVFNVALFKDARLLELARATGISIAAMSVRFLMANREIATILVGASTPEEIEESVVAAQAGPLPPDLHQTLEALTSA